MPAIFATVEYKISHVFAVIEDHINRSLVFSIYLANFLLANFFGIDVPIYQSNIPRTRCSPDGCHERKEFWSTAYDIGFTTSLLTTCLHAIAVKIFLYCLRLFSASKQILNGLFETGLQRYYLRRLVNTNCSKNLLSTLSSIKVACDSLTCSNFRND